VEIAHLLEKEERPVGEVDVCAATDQHKYKVRVIYAGSVREMDGPLRETFTIWIPRIAQRSNLKDFWLHLPPRAGIVPLVGVVILQA
jgi:hypothetical protein